MFLLLMLTWLIHAASVLSGLPPPVNVTLKSNNFYHVLLWDRGARAPSGVTYKVTFNTNRIPCCKQVDGCERVVDPLVCNLTTAFSDSEETYHILVTALLGSEESYRPYRRDFSPIRDTELETPVLVVSSCNSTVCVDMDAPLSHLRSIYDSFWYEMRVQSSGTQRDKLKSFRSLQRIVFEDTPAGYLYCVSVRFSDTIVPRNSNFSAPKCVYIHSTLSRESLLVAPLSLVVLCLLVVFFLLYCTGFICLKKQPLPSVLTSVHHSEELVVVSFHPYVSSLLSIKHVTLPNGQTENCFSETDSSEDEDEENSAERRTANTTQYATKGSLCSSLEKGLATNQYAPSTEGLRSSDIRQEEPEEVNLLTLTFGRNEKKELESPVLLSEIEPIVWDLTDNDKECDEEESEMEYNEQSGYMSR